MNLETPSQLSHYDQRLWSVSRSMSYMSYTEAEYLDSMLRPPGARLAVYTFSLSIEVFVTNYVYMNKQTVNKLHL